MALVTWSAAAGTSPQAPSPKSVVEAAYADLVAGAAPPAPRLGRGQAPAVIVPFGPESQFSPLGKTAAGNGFIVASDLGPPGQIDAAFSNDWYQETPTEIVEVYAGRLVSDPSQGVVIVAVWDTSHAVWLAGGRYLAPKAIGPVSVVGATGDLVMLKGAVRTIMFDPRTGLFQ